MLLQDSPALYPQAIESEPVTGEVQLELLVDQRGSVAEVRLVQGVHPLLDAASLAAASGLRFRPAMLGEVPVPVRIGFSYRFVPPAAKAAAIPPPRGAAPATGKLTGLVRGKGHRRPVPGANLIAPDGTHAQTDATGHFTLGLPIGKQIIRVQAPGFLPAEWTESLRPDQTLEVVYAIEPIRLNAYETIVQADRDRTEVSRVELRQQELREVPGTMGDPFRVVMLLPGVGSLMSGVSYPVVRGSAPASSGYFLDGIRVPILFHLFLGPAVVHPDFIDSIRFMPGAPPPEYGRLLGGVIDGRVSRPREDRLRASFYLDLINAGGFVEYPFEKSGTNVTLAGRFSYTPWLLGLTSNALNGSKSGSPAYVLNFWDYQGRLEQKVGDGRLRLFAFGSSDRMGTESDESGVPTAMQKVLFHRIDLRYQRTLAGGPLEMGVTWGQDELAFDSQDIGSNLTQFYTVERSLAARASWRIDLGKRVKLGLGSDLDHRSAEAVLQGGMGFGTGAPFSVNQPVAVGTFTGAWTELVWTPNAVWTIVPGLRLDNYHLVPGQDFFAAEPRLTVRSKLSKSLALKAAAGLFHQQPTTLIQLPVVDVASLQYGLQEGAQLDTGFEWIMMHGLELTADVYFNPLLRTVEISPFDPNTVQSANLRPFDPTRIPTAREVLSPGDAATRGYAYGLELMLRHPLGGDWFGWISYSLQRSMRRTYYNRYDASGNYVGRSVGYLPYAFDQTHIFNAVVSYKLPHNWTVGAVLHFNTGRPETGNMTSRTLREGTINGRSAWIPISRDQADRLPAFVRADLRVAKTWAFDDYTLDAYLDVLNASLASEVLAFSYTGGAGRGLGILEKSAIGLPIVLPILGLKATY
jgi:TonB family protein